MNFKLEKLDWLVKKVQLFDGEKPTNFYATKRMDNGQDTKNILNNIKLY